jgi:hypothetical protein
VHNSRPRLTWTADSTAVQVEVRPHVDEATFALGRSNSTQPAEQDRDADDPALAAEQGHTADGRRDGAQSQSGPTDGSASSWAVN